MSMQKVRTAGGSGKVESADEMAGSKTAQSAADRAREALIAADTASAEEKRRVQEAEAQKAEPATKRLCCGRDCCR